MEEPLMDKLARQFRDRKVALGRMTSEPLPIDKNSEARKPAFVASPSSREGVSTEGFNRGGSAVEGKCECCGRAYRDWVAASPIWNAVIRGGSINGDEEYNFLCADCFMGLAEDRGIAAAFYVDAERVRDGLETTTPSGRVWSAAARVWKHPPRRREEADTLLPFFSTDWELLRAVAGRFGQKTPQQLASRARDLEERGLVESRWDRCFTIKEWRRASLGLPSGDGAKQSPTPSPPITDGEV
jgi:hypothetical protein